MFEPKLIKAKTEDKTKQKETTMRFSIFTFAARMGEERTADLARSLPAYFRSKLIDGNGQFNLFQALKSMPEYIGFTTFSQSQVP